MNVWQVSGGPLNRNYVEDFLRDGIALLGRGDAGPWSVERDDKDFGGKFVRHFASRMEVGDVILLRSGRSSIRAVGLVADVYRHLEQFDDVNGWDLQHARRVRWRRLEGEGQGFEDAVFGANPPRIAQVHKAVVRQWVNAFMEAHPGQWQELPLPELRAEEPLLDNDKVPSALQTIVAKVRDCARLMWNREEFGNHPSEDELIVHFVAPFLIALGWSTECIAVKWRYIDVALFSKLPRSRENCRFVIEVKRLGAGVEVGALQQAIDYANTLPSPPDVVVTDGVRYRMYGAAQDFAEIAYANLARLKGSSLDLFRMLRAPLNDVGEIYVA